MTAMIFSLNREVREAGLDVKAIRKKIKECRDRAYEWLPAEANARQRLAALSRERGEERAEEEEGLPSAQPRRPKGSDAGLRVVK
jgi:hypothetical protein